MEDLKTISTVIINVKKYAIFIICYLLLGISVVILMSISLNMPGMAIFGFIAVVLIPVFFEKKFRRRFTKNALVNFNREMFSIELTNMDSGDSERKDIWNYKDIQSFKAIDSAKDDSSYVKLILHNGDKISYSFINQGIQGNPDRVTDAMQNFIILHNNEPGEFNKIAFRPTFLAGKGGKYIIIFLTIFLVAAIIIEIYYKPSVIPHTLFGGLALYLVIFLQWKKDSDQYNQSK